MFTVICPSLQFHDHFHVFHPEVVSLPLQDVAQKYKIEAMPTFLFFKNKEQVSQCNCLNPAHALHGGLTYFAFVRVSVCVSVDKISAVDKISLYFCCILTFFYSTFLKETKKAICVLLEYPCVQHLNMRPNFLDNYILDMFDRGKLYNSLLALRASKC